MLKGEIVKINWVSIGMLALMASVGTAGCSGQSLGSKANGAAGENGYVVGDQMQNQTQSNDAQPPQTPQTVEQQQLQIEQQRQLIEQLRNQPASQ